MPKFNQNQEISVPYNKHYHLAKPLQQIILQPPNSQKEILRNKKEKTYLPEAIATDQKHWVEAVESKNYPIYGTHFRVFQKLSHLYIDSEIPETLEETKFAHEMIIQFFLKKTLKSKIAELKREYNKQTRLDRIRNKIYNSTFNNHKQNSIHYLDILKDYIFRDCRMDAHDKGCRTFNYDMLTHQISGYQQNLAQQILLNYDQDNSNIFLRGDILPSEQREYSTTRFIIRDILGFDELFFFRLRNNFRSNTSIGECKKLYDHKIREFEYSYKYWELHPVKKYIRL